MAAAKKNEKVTRKARAKPAPREPSLTAITLHGFKPFRDETRIEIRPLTLLAGANSSGKSSAMQPLLLLKQTLEATYDPGPLLLDGPNIRFTMMDQLLWAGAQEHDRSDGFTIGLSVGENGFSLRFHKAESGGAKLDRVGYTSPTSSYELWRSMPQEKRRSNAIFPAIERETLAAKSTRVDLIVPRTRFALVAQASATTKEILPSARYPNGARFVRVLGRAEPFAEFEPIVDRLIHLPGLRGNPLRSYPTAHVDVRFPGLFQNYVASVVLAWKEAGDVRVEQLDKAVHALGLSWKVDARRFDATNIEIRVGRMPSQQKGGSHDLVNIADVGFGVSQTLPVVVALLTAAPGQVVYLEEPEIHLHPRAQVALAGLLLDAAKRGVVVIAETHSDLLLRSIQRAVAAGEANPSIIALHWFERDKDGATQVTTAELDAAGTYGEWPIDFGDVDLKLESDFLDASLRHPT